MKSTRNYVILPFDKYQRIPKTPKKQTGAGKIRKNKGIDFLQETRPTLVPDSIKGHEVNQPISHERARKSAPPPGLPDRTKKSRTLKIPYSKQNGRGDWKLLWRKMK